VFRSEFQFDEIVADPARGDPRGGIVHVRERVESDACDSRIGRAVIRLYLLVTIEKWIEWL